jgi:hypothetical protein
MNVRNPAVAGSFYPFSREDVLGQLRELFAYWDIDLDKLGQGGHEDLKGIVVPHAGWSYSGYVAAKTFSKIPDVDTVVLMGPNHHGLGPDFSISSDDAWETPLGNVTVDKEFADSLAKSSHAELDEMAHLREHSIEVQLPFLQTILKDFKIVPVSIKHYAADDNFLEACRYLGKSLAEEIMKSDKRVLLVASTDFTHYESQEVAESKDQTAISSIKDMDEEELFDVISANKISMCGYAGVAACLAACKELGAKNAELIEYMTSGDITGDRSQVVGYGGLGIY